MKKYQILPEISEFIPTHRAKKKCHPFFDKGDIFMLDNKSYINEDETVVIKSSNVTGKVFTKI